MAKYHYNRIDVFALLFALTQNITDSTFNLLISLISSLNATLYFMHHAARIAQSAVHNIRIEKIAMVFIEPVCKCSL